MTLSSSERELLRQLPFLYPHEPAVNELRQLADPAMVEERLRGFIEDRKREYPALARALGSEPVIDFTPSSEDVKKVYDYLGEKYGAQLPLAVNDLMREFADDSQLGSMHWRISGWQIKDFQLVCSDADINDAMRDSDFARLLAMRDGLAARLNNDLKNGALQTSPMALLIIEAIQRRIGKEKQPTYPERAASSPLTEAENQFIQHLQITPTACPRQRDAILAQVRNLRHDPEGAAAMIRKSINEIAASMPHLTAWLQRGNGVYPFAGGQYESNPESHVDLESECSLHALLNWRPTTYEERCPKGMVCLDEYVRDALYRGKRDSFLMLLTGNRAELLEHDLSEFHRLEKEDPASMLRSGTIAFDINLTFEEEQRIREKVGRDAVEEHLKTVLFEYVDDILYESNMSGWRLEDETLIRDNDIEEDGDPVENLKKQLDILKYHFRENREAFIKRLIFDIGDETSSPGI